MIKKNTGQAQKAKSGTTAYRSQVVVWGMLAAYPFGGMTWQVLHYLQALRQLGYDVWYVEETRANSLSPVDLSPTTAYAANVAHLKKWMAFVGMDDRWVYSPPDDASKYLGALDEPGLLRLYQHADMVFNICGAQELRDYHDSISCLVYVETDPVQRQVQVAQGKTHWIELLGRYHYLFTYAENIGAPDCLIPVERFAWLTTRPPVHMPWWETASAPGAGARISSVATWKHEGKDIRWNGHLWRWSKHHAFREFMHLAADSVIPLEMAVGEVEEKDRQQLLRYGWVLKDPITLSDPARYQHYIQQSAGEFTVAKEQYVKPVSGWFSDRSVCYLAAGRPVVTQETGFSKFIPAGTGLFAFRDNDQALSAIEAIAANYSDQSRIAADIAREYFAAETVVAKMIADMG